MSIHTLSVLVENKPGVLQRVSGLFARRGFNIHSLAVGTTEDPTLSRMTIVVNAADTPLEQITKQLHKLVNVIKIQDLDPSEMVDRELVLFKVNAPPDSRAELIELANIFRARIIDVGKNSLTVEATGTADKLQAMEDLLRAYGIKELARTGKIALARGSRENGA
jgi:acetolactate synthase-1/3 small subunit